MEHTSTSNPKNYLTYVLGGLLIIAAFFIGSLWTKVQTLESGSGKIAGQQAGQYPVDPGAGAAGQGANQVQTADNVPPVTDGDFIKGSKDADIILVEYSDFECPFCKRFHPTMEQVLKDYGNKVAWVYRHYPLSFHPQAQPLAEASECVAEQLGNDGFWKFADAVFAAASVDSSSGSNAAAQVGVNMAQYNECIKNGKYTQKVKDVMSGGASAGISGTPGTILISKDGKTELISGALPYDQIKPVLDKYL